MITREELVCLWFDYRGYTFAKLEKVLKEFKAITDVFDKNLIKNAFFDQDCLAIKEALLNLEEEK